MNTQQPIGIFDSGLGGLSVWLEIVKRLPSENLLYLADSGNCPYGNRSRAEITALSVRNVEFLLEKGAKIIVVACNTATAAAIEHLRRTFDVPFIGTEPPIKPAALQSKTQNIGVLATRGTLESALFHRTKDTFAKGVTVHTQVGEGLVQAVENQQINTTETRLLLQKYLQPMLENNVDSIVLGCTHYPFLSPVMETLIPPSVALVNPAAAIAQQTERELRRINALQTQDLAAPRYDFFTTGEVAVLKKFLKYLHLETENVFDAAAAIAFR